jgi:alpha-mannosidase
VIALTSLIQLKIVDHPVLVRCLPAGTPDILSSIESPFAVEGARNVFLETVKRGEYDSFEKAVDLGHDKSATSTTTTVILRLYEAYGGHAQARLLISRHIPVLKAFTTNLLEDEDEELYVLRSSEDSSDDSSGCALSLSFRGFEVKTIKLVLGRQPPKPANKQV